MQEGAVFHPIMKLIYDSSTYCEACSTMPLQIKTASRMTHTNKMNCLLEINPGWRMHCLLQRPQIGNSKARKPRRKFLIALGKHYIMFLYLHATKQEGTEMYMRACDSISDELRRYAAKTTTYLVNTSLRFEGKSYLSLNKPEQKTDIKSKLRIHVNKYLSNHLTHR